MAAMFYDSLLLFAVLFAATAILLPLTGGVAVTPDSHWYQAYLLGVGALYFGWFWVHGGQTLGMRAWRLRLRAAAGGPAGWRGALVRYAAALLSWLPLGAGFLWALFDRDRRAWHDRLSGTVLEVVERRRPGAPAP